MNEYYIPVVPMGAVRMTRRGKFVNESAKRYLTYKDFIKLHISRQAKQEPIANQVGVDIVFTMPIPPSWSKKKQKEAVGQYHNKKPDIDNLVKGLFDSLNGLIWKDDNQVAKLRAVKIYGENPGITVEIRGLENGAI